MGVLKAVGDFLFGKPADIFDEKGNVIHKHPKKKWDAWQNKFKTDPSYNWRNHTGTLAGRDSNSNKNQKPQP
jgi:hypothetical protein